MLFTALIPLSNTCEYLASTFCFPLYFTLYRALYSRQSIWKCDVCFSLVILKNRECSTKAICDNCQRHCSELINQRVASEFRIIKVFRTESLQLQREQTQFAAYTLELRLYSEIYFMNQLKAAKHVLFRRSFSGIEAWGQIQRCWSF